LKRQNRNLTVSPDTRTTELAKGELDSSWSRLVRRRKFLQGLGAAGAVGAALSGTTLFAKNDKKLSKGDANLLQLALTIELIEADLAAIQRARGRGRQERSTESGKSSIHRCASKS
jgi:hypothetical protein